MYLRRSFQTRGQSDFCPRATAETWLGDDDDDNGNNNNNRMMQPNSTTHRIFFSWLFFIQYAYCPRRLWLSSSFFLLGLTQPTESLFLPLLPIRCFIPTKQMLLPGFILPLSLFLPLSSLYFFYFCLLRRECHHRH